MDLDQSVRMLTDSSTVRWGVGLIVGMPMLIVLLGELIHRCERAGHPLASTLHIVRNFLVPALAILILLLRVVELDSSSMIMKILTTLVWISVIHTGLSLIKDVVFASAAEGSWQSRVPKLLLDLARTILVLIGAAIVLSTVWEFELTNLVAALGVGSIVIGLALQEPMGNLFAGMALLFERPLILGDWITVEGITGKVIEINWRSVHIETTTREVRIVPNSSLYKGSFSNLSRPDTIRTEVIELGFSYDDPPNKVKEVLMDTLESTPGVLKQPEPVIRTLSYADFAINYRIIFSVASQEDVPEVRDNFMTRVWYAVSRSGLNIPYPIQTQIEMSQQDFERKHATRPEEMLRQFPQFSVKDAGDRTLIGSGANQRFFARGECVVSEGKTLEGLYLILRGTVRLAVRDRAGVEHVISELGPGEYFGEQAIMGARTSELTVVAIDDLDVLVLDPESLSVVLEHMPRLAREIGGLMDLRRKAAQSARKVNASASR